MYMHIIYHCDVVWQHIMPKSGAFVRMSDMQWCMHILGGGHVRFQLGMVVSRDQYTVGARKMVMFSFHSILSNRHLAVPVHHSACKPVQLIVAHGFLMCKKIKASTFTHRVESIVLYHHSLLNSLLRQCAIAALRFQVCSAIVARLGLKLAIDNQMSSHCHSTTIVSRCNRSTRAMLILAYLDYSGILFELASIGIVGHIFHHRTPSRSVSIFL